MKDREKMEYYDENERELIESVENGEWVSSGGDKTEEIQKAAEYAAKTLKKDKKINITLSERDLKNLKVKALEEGIPPKTLGSMILHKYVTGKLK